MSTHKALIGALPLIASALGDKYGVKVVFGNYPTAATDGDTIFMPNLPLENKAVGVLANGFIDHEASHVKETDMSVFKRSDVRGLRRHMLNIVEDLRIEQAMMNRYPGTRKNLSRLVDHLVDTGFLSLNEDMGPADLLVATALFCGRADVLAQKGLYDLAGKAEKRFEATLGKGPLVKLRALLKEAETLGSTQEALSLADKIITMLEEEQKKAEQQQGQSGNDQSQNDNSDDDGSGDTDSSSGDSNDGQGDDQDKSSDGSGGNQDDAEDSGEKGNDSSSQDDSDDQTGAQGGSSEDDDSDEDGDSSGQAGGDDSDSDDSSNDAGGNGAGGDNDIAEALKKALEASDDDVTVKSDMGDAISDQLTKDLGQVPSDEIVRCDPSEEMECLGQRPAVSRSEVKRESVKMRAKLIAKIETMLRERTYTARSGRKIEGRKLSRVAVGDPRIFRKTDEKRGLDTAIHLLVDRSGSMATADRMGIAMKSTMALMSAFDNIKGVSSAATMFPGVTRLTDFHESVVQTKHRYVPSTMGSTPLAEALLWLIKDMAERREGRKIVIVLTDGMPNNPQLADRLIRRMAKHDIEVIGVGIETMATEGLFPTSAVINDVKELPNALFNLIQEKLVQ